MANPNCIYCNKRLSYLHLDKGYRKRKPNLCDCGNPLYCCHCEGHCPIYLHCFKCYHGKRI